MERDRQSWVPRNNKQFGSATEFSGTLNFIHNHLVFRDDIIP